MNAVSLIHMTNNPTMLINRDAILAALDIIIGAVEKRSTIPILSNVLLTITSGEADCLTVRATDLDVQVSVNVRAQVPEEFSTTLPAHTLHDLLKRTPNGERATASLELLPSMAPMKQATDAKGEPMVDDNDNPIMEAVRVNQFTSDATRIKLARASYQLQSLPAGDFPEMAAFKKEPFTATVSGSSLWNAIDAVQPAISTEERRYYLNGIFLHVVGPDTLAMTATDGHRLLRQEIRGVDGLSDKMPGIIVPRKTVGLLHKLMRGKDCPIEVELFWDDERFSAMWDATTLVSKVIDGTYPDYGRVIPTGNDKIATVNGKMLKQCVAAVTSMSSERGRAVKCQFEPGKLTLAVNNPDSGHASIDMDCEFDSDFLEVGFNSKYLIDMAERAAPNGRQVTFKLHDAGSPTLILGNMPGWSGVLMPMRC